MNDRFESVVQLIHFYTHRMGTGDSCDACRSLAVQVVEVLGIAAMERRYDNLYSLFVDSAGFEPTPAELGDE